MKDELRAYIDYTIQKTIEEYKRNGLIRENNDVCYSDASAILSKYYQDGEKEASIAYALQGIRFDPYFRIIGMYFKEHKTIERIAEELGVDVSTVVRNKKRLCLIIYKEII